MLSIFLYCVGVMYTPGPVNILSLNRGAQSRFSAHIPFCTGVGAALCIWFIVIGYTGNAVINDGIIPLISVLGCAFILYLAYKIIFADVDGMIDGGEGKALKFWDGLFMQLLNPKSFLAVLPVTAIQFPAAGIEGIQISIWSMALGTLGFGAPLAYAFMGAKVSRFITNPRYLKWFNNLMGAALIMAALDMGYNHIYLALR